MASKSTPVELDPRAIRALERIAKAIEHHNQLTIEIEKNKKEQNGSA